MEIARFTQINEAFTCEHCGQSVPLSSSSCRNHCPFCLHSKHLDINPGDRAANCGGIMEPVSIHFHTKKGYQIVHRCQLCGEERRNIASLEDDIQADRLDVILDLMQHPKR